MSIKTVALLDKPECRDLAMADCKSKNFKFVEFEALVRVQIVHAGDPTRYHMYAAFDDILDRIKVEINSE